MFISSCGIIVVALARYVTRYYCLIVPCFHRFVIFWCWIYSPVDYSFSSPIEPSFFFPYSSIFWLNSQFCHVQAETIINIADSNMRHDIWYQYCSTDLHRTSLRSVDFFNGLLQTVSRVTKISNTAIVFKLPHVCARCYSRDSAISLVCTFAATKNYYCCISGGIAFCNVNNLISASVLTCYLKHYTCV